MPGEYNHEAARLQQRAATYEGLYRFCMLVLGEAVREAPVETGTLRGSAMIVEPSQGVNLPASGGSLGHLSAPLAGALLELWIVFPLIYAAYQHEGHRADGSYEIHEHPQGGKTKYLEDPLKAHAPDLTRAIAAAQVRAR